MRYFFKTCQILTRYSLVTTAYVTCDLSVNHLTVYLLQNDTVRSDNV